MGSEMMQAGWFFTCIFALLALCTFMDCILCKVVLGCNVGIGFSVACQQIFPCHTAQRTPLGCTPSVHSVSPSWQLLLYSVTALLACRAV